MKVIVRFPNYESMVINNVSVIEATQLQWPHFPGDLVSTAVPEGHECLLIASKELGPMILPFKAIEGIIDGD